MSPIPNTFPDCDFIKILARKAEERHDIDLNIIGRLDEFRDRVSKEVLYIHTLFPEYTLHEEHYHLSKLFHVADTILGIDLLESMNCTELFVLAISLYGHDWGMAVSEDEKRYIVTGVLPDGFKQDDFKLLPNEHENFIKYTRKQQYPIKENAKIADLDINLWREYVRQTHANRSGVRVKYFFDPINGGIADAASRACLGHALNFEDIQDYNLYPPDFAVLSQTINLRALTVYLRLIDLLDLSEDRTPYVIWKFVAPRDKKSKMEWAKHRSVHSVTCPPYLEGRIIRVEGGTDDHRVYAALQDLKIYSEEQLRGCNDILARMNDPRHKLNIYHIDWRIAAQGFKPIPIQFEFDREKMFELLGNEIYQGDYYVFLRELLQNSIDAIRLRREILKRKGMAIGGFGTIHVRVEHGANGDAIVTWKDDGIGMDEYIIENYLSVAGKSYYSSADFEREEIAMDPISRFGIGILSCFMVANRIEIETFKDPYSSPNSTPLKILIEDVRRQFRVETCSHENAEIGSTIRVFVEGKFIQGGNESKETKRLQVIDYLSIVAGFVEFPIIIDEGDRKTIILHARQDPKSIIKRFGDSYAIQQLFLGYRMSDLAIPQDISEANNEFTYEEIDISKDLGLTKYEGQVTYVIPKNNIIDYTLSGRIGELEINRLLNNNDIQKRVRFKQKYIGLFYTDYFEGESAGLSRSCLQTPIYSVYKDGILIPRMPFPTNIQQYDSHYNLSLPTPRVVVNIPNSNTQRIDVARDQIIGDSGSWYNPILEAILNYKINHLLDNFENLNPSIRLHKITQLIFVYQLLRSRVWEKVDHDAWPLIFITPNGKINIEGYNKIKMFPIFVFPAILIHEANRIFSSNWSLSTSYGKYLTHWRGTSSHLPSNPGVAGNVLTFALSISEFPLTENHVLAFARFLEPPWNGNPPMLQQEWILKESDAKSIDLETLYRKCVKSPSELTPLEISEFLKANNKEFHSRMEIMYFRAPYDKVFAYGWESLNLNHPYTLALIQCSASILLSKFVSTIDLKDLGIIDDNMRSLPFFSYRRERYYWKNIIKTWRTLWANIHRLELFDTNNVVKTSLKINDFVPGSIILSSGIAKDIVQNLGSKRIMSNKLFGMEIKSGIKNKKQGK